MQFRIKLTNGLSLTFERSPLGNINIAVIDDNAPKETQTVANTVEKGSDFSKMAAILSD